MSTQTNGTPNRFSVVGSDGTVYISGTVTRNDTTPEGDTSGRVEYQTNPQADMTATQAALWPILFGGLQA